MGPPPGALTDIVEFEWFVTEERWERAATVLMDVIARRLPEALPLNYGFYEPYEHEFEPEALARFILDDPEYQSGFWKSRWPCFGGSWFYEPRFGLGRLGLSFDLRRFDVERGVELFAEAAQELGAFFAAAQVDTAYQIFEDEPVLTGQTIGTETLVNSVMGWRGLPPVPMWLSWFGEPYRELVAEHLLGGGAAREVEGGIFVRMTDEPLPPSELGDWPLPPELTYRHRPPYTRTPDGGIRSNPPEHGDEAERIPSLGPPT